MDSYPDFLRQSLLELNYKHPSNIQKIIYETFIKPKGDAMINRQNLIAQSLNGSGKTLAYLSLMIRNMMASKVKPQQTEQQPQIQQINQEIQYQDCHVIQGLIITPTREIAMQVQEYLDFLTKSTDETLKSRLTTFLVIGGLDIKEQRRKILVNKPNIIIGTPGRIKEMIIDREWLSLTALDTLIIDEADKFCVQNTNYYQSDKNKQGKKNNNMNQGKFFEDLASIINLIDEQQVQICAFSATFNSNTMTQLKNLIKKAIVIKAQSNDSPKNVKGLVDKEEQILKNIQKIYISLKSNDFNSKLIQLGELLTQLMNQSSDQQIVLDSANQESEKQVSSQIIIFFNFKHQGEQLAKFIRSKLNLTTVFFHGDQSQEDRLKAFEKMRLMEIKVILSTDLLSRGIDLPDVKTVINFDMPLNEAEFRHRIGRSGRFGRAGMCVSIISETEQKKIQYISQMIQSQVMIQVNTLNLLASLKSQTTSEDQNEQLMAKQRQEKEVKLIKNQKHIEKNFSQKQQDYKKQKILSKEGKMSEWQDTTYTFYDENQFMYVEENEEDEEFKMDQDQEMIDESYEDQNHIKTLAQLLELDSQDLDANESKTSQSNRDDKIQSTQQLQTDKKSFCISDLILFESDQFKEFKQKINDKIKQDSTFRQLVDELMFANYCQYRDYYQALIKNQ
ncbi:atp-dependent rna helicase [Stylonychia lemnae]|uniref:ATP-dependent RNA helicase n=1 Tax=Stylonychia lemnae TaxID=5949 RepID=A0A078BBQ1_STYLE|nr:atp-dependent rna helicase [Stylonychia lemnae]|eukprot:CDW91641.1 atp-dependent rna helicase [Stylonychia lemnae]